MATTGGWLRNVNAAFGNPMKMLLPCSRVIRESVKRFRDQITRHLKFGRARTQNRFPLLLIAPMGRGGRLRE
jgi:hypothetical protein